MKKFVSICLSALLMLSLAACSDADSSSDAAPLSDEEVSDYMETLESGAITLSDYEKRTLAIIEATPPEQLSLDVGETYVISVPFETESLTFSSEDDHTVKVSEDGTMTALKAGACIIHTNADGILLHTVVTVAGDGDEATDNSIYAAYTQDEFDPDAVEYEIGVYASSQCGFTIVDSLKDDETAKSDDYQFTYEYGHSGATVRFKLLTVIDSLQEQGYTRVAMSVSEDGEAIHCTFYYT